MEDQEKRLQSMVYLSLGNLPSQWAHTTQIANMAQAFSTRIDHFTLVTGGDVPAALRGMDDEFRQWYNLHREFNVVRLPVHLRKAIPFPKEYSSRLYKPMAVLYACMRSPSVVYTRTLTIAKRLLRTCLPVLWECHAPVDGEKADAAFLTSENLIGVVTTSPVTTEMLKERGLPGDKVLTLPNAVELNDFQPYQDRQAARQALNLAVERPTVLYSGHLYDYKGIPTMLELARRMPQVLFMFVGGWPEDVDRLRDAARRRQLENVQFVGHVPKSQLATYLYAADVLVLPTSNTWEEADVTNPLKLFDYMAVKRPIVASALPNIACIVRDREQAVLAEPDNPAAFEAGIKEILARPEWAAQLAEEAYSEVQKYTWDNRAAQIVSFIEDRLFVATNGRKPLSHLLQYLRN